MIIKKGFNDKPTTIKISSHKVGEFEDELIELWINESGKDEKETLSYLTIEELYQLFKEIKIVGKDCFD